MIKSNLIDDFLAYMSSTKGASENTIKEYYYDLRTFLKFILVRKEIVKDFDVEDDEFNIDLVDIEILKTITKNDIYAYNSYLDRVRHNSNKTKFRKVSSVRTFFNYLTSKIDILEYNPVENIDMPKIEKTLPTYLTLEEAKKLLNTILESNTGLKYKYRDYAIVTLFLNCGLRLSELSSLDIRDIKSDDTIRVIGKGNKERTIYLNNACKNAIDNYLTLRPKVDTQALFLSNRNTRISNRQIQRMVEKYIFNSGLDPSKYTVHKLRHTAATLMYQHGGADIRSLQEILGHESIKTTEIYTHVNNASLKETINKNPLSDIENNPE